MSERKVLNKYYPPDFDPSKIPRTKQPKNHQYVVRLMAPFSMRCTSCFEYVYKGKKFNARKETVEGEDYLGIKIYRFYIRCPICAAEITFKTDPKNSDYVCEQGATRNFEQWRSDEQAREEARRKEEEEEENNPIRALENRTTESKREIEVEEALEEIRALNAKQQRVNIDNLIKDIQEDRKITTADSDEDEIAIQKIFGNKKSRVTGEFVEGQVNEHLEVKNDDVSVKHVEENNASDIVDDDDGFYDNSPLFASVSTSKHSEKSINNEKNTLKKDKLSLASISGFLKKRKI